MIYETPTLPKLPKEDKMNGNMFFNFDYDGKTILVPAPEIGHEQSTENMSNYGTEYGIMQIIIMDGDNEHRITSGRSMTFAPGETHQTSTTVRKKAV